MSPKSGLLHPRSRPSTDLERSRTSKGGGIASPPCSFEYSGPCIVAGNAWCLHDDLESARSMVGDAPVIAVNGAAREVKALALYSKHPERFLSLRWIHHQRRKFGGGFTVHGSRFTTDCPHVDHWWKDARGGGGSAWGARKLAWLMGFDPVILAGCPLEVGSYAGHKLGWSMTKPDVINGLRQGIEAEPEWHEGCYSMSGWTGEFLGGPE